LILCIIRLKQPKQFIIWQLAKFQFVARIWHIVLLWGEFQLMDETINLYCMELPC